MALCASAEQPRDVVVAMVGGALHLDRSGPLLLRAWQAAQIFPEWAVRSLHHDQDCGQGDSA